MKKNIPIIIITALCFILGTVQSFSQSSRDYLKTPPYVNMTTPAWAVEMYEDNPNVLLVDQQYKAYLSHNGYQKNIHTQNYKHWRKAIDNYVLESGYLDLPTEVEKKKYLDHHLSKRTTQRSPFEWKAMGPFETYTNDGQEEVVSWQANVYTIDQSQSDPNIVYVGTEAGGIFKSIDKGLSWNMVSGSSLIRTVRTIKVHPSNPDIVYAGDRDYIYKTIDGGDSWEIVYTQGGFAANDIAINPDNPDIVMVASVQGLYRSSNSGQDWVEIMDDTTWDVELKPNDSNTVYVLKSNPQLVRTEFWKSEDAGLSFKLQENGWYKSNSPDKIDGGGRMTVTPADPNRVYVILVGASKASDNGYIGIYRSRDSGESWELTDPPVGGPYTDEHPNLATLSNTNTLQQGYYNLGIAASDTDPDVLLIGCLNLWRSEDAGASFQVLGGYRGIVPWIHPDQQEIEINGNDMWVVNDGGINYSTDYFVTHESRKSGLNASDFWGLGSGWNEDLVVGGRYHNGNSAHRPSFGEGNFLRLGGGEAPTGYVQPGGESIAYFSDIDAKIIPYSLDEATRNATNLSLYPYETYFASNYSELEFSPSCYTHMWLGRENKLYKSEDNGNSFDVVHTFGNSDDLILNIEISRADPKVMYVYQRTTFYGAILWVTKDGGLSWDQKPFPPTESQRSGLLQVDDENPGTLWVSFGHQRNDDSKIFRTDDFGETWTNLTSPILNGDIVSAIYHQPGTENLFLATYLGIYMYDGVEWEVCSNGLPSRIFTNRMLPFYKDHKLRIATYGNGIWQMKLPESNYVKAQATVDKVTSECSRDTFYFDDYSIVEHDDDISWEWSFTPDPIFVSDRTARNPKVVFGSEGSYDVSLKVSNTRGSDTYEHPSMIQIIDDNCSPDVYPGEALFVRQSGDDYVQLPSMDLVTTDFTLMAWIYPQGVQNDYTGIVFNDRESNGLNISTGNQLGFHHVSAGSDAWAWSSGLTVTPDVWSHVVLVCNKNGATVYLNGVPAERPLDLGSATLEAMKIGSYKGWTDRNFNGFIDEVSIWDRALSEEEVRSHRHITKTEENAPGLHAYYQFNNDRNRIIDRIGVRHGAMRGISLLIPSDTPVGGGTAGYHTGGSGTDNFVFEEENVEIIAKSDTDAAITVSRLAIPAQNNNIDDLLLENAYWITNGYGNVEIEELSFTDLSVPAIYGSSPEGLLLYERSANDSQVDFESTQAATQAVSGAQGAMTFQYSDDINKQLVIEESLMSSSHELHEKKLTLYPNPTGSTFYVNGLNEEAILTVFNMKGDLIMEKNIEVGQKSESLESLPSGVYLYSLQTATKLRSGRIVKQ